MRSNIIQMLLNASSGKGGSSPGQPESEWTIVHLLGKWHLSTSAMRCVTFKDHNIKIESFAYPYDYEFFGFKFLLKKHGIKKLFGENRITIENYMLKNVI